MLYDFLEENIRTRFVPVRDLKTGPRGQVTLLRHRKSGTQIILRSFQGSAAVYQKLLTVNCSNLPRVAEAAEKDGHVLVLEEYIQGDPLSLLLEDGRTLPPKQAADIARQVGVSADHLTRQFNRTLGITPSEYLRRFRFARAIELLRQQTAVGDVSRMVGFSHISHFSREFKAMFGMNPSEYARRYPKPPAEKG